MEQSPHASPAGPVTLQAVRKAAAATARLRRRTPLLKLPGVAGVWVKAENLQLTGSFKVRGALAALAGLSSGQLAQGVVTHSSGNHGQGLACAAQLFGTHAAVVIPEGAPEVKVRRTEAWGARVVRCGASAAEREEAARHEAETHGLTLIPPFDHPGVVAGQGSVGLEIFEDLPEVANVLVPVGGGGLLAGIVTALTALKPGVRIFGVEPELAADATESFNSGRPVSWPASLTNRTVADGVRTQRVGDLTFPLILEGTAGFLQASEEGIRAAAAWYLQEAKLVSEPTGALTLAAWRELASPEEVLAPGPTVLVLSGGNADPAFLGSLAGDLQRA